MPALETALPSAGIFVGAVVCASELHEGAHAAAAVLLGYAPKDRPLGSRVTDVPGISLRPRQQSIVRHSGWIASVVLACVVYTLSASRAIIAAFVLVALEAVASDLLGIGRFRSTGDRFFCGNFGLLLLDGASADKVLPALSQMHPTSPAAPPGARRWRLMLFPKRQSLRSRRVL